MHALAALIPHECVFPYPPSEILVLLPCPLRMVPVSLLKNPPKNDQKSPPSLDVEMLLQDTMHAFLLVPDLSIESPCYLCL